MKRKIKDISVDEQEVDLLDLTICLQRHNCKPGNCRKWFKGELGPCRFKMPKDYCDQTKIEYKRALIKGTYFFIKNLKA
jgi:hypothetical protein